MTPFGAINLTAPTAFWAAATFALAAAAAAVVRRPTAPRLTVALVGVGLLLFVLAAGAPVWHRPADGDVWVMVDLSPSTRGAQYRDPVSLRARIGRLLGDVPHKVLLFSDLGTTRPLAGGGAETAPLADLSAEATVFAPPDASAVVLFSDARFAVPNVVPPTFVVVDPLLEAPPDAAVERLEARENECSVATRNDGGPRDLGVTGTPPASRKKVSPGRRVFTEALTEDAGAGPITARLSAGDAWPENDALSAWVPPPPGGERWWVGDGPRAGASAGAFRLLSPSDLPTDPAAYLAPSLIILSNVSASDVDRTRQQRLTQFVRDLGGGLVIVGGSRAFAAGGYAVGAIESLSPLAATPPDPAAHWVLLVDSSGSMNAPAGGRIPGTRWRVAADAASALLAALPPNDATSVGGFAAGVTWWTRGRRAADAAAQPLPPAGAAPSGPTELRRAIADVAAAAPPGPPTQLVLLTDGNAPLPEPAVLAEVLRRANVRLHLLAIGDAGGAGALPALGNLAADTGGTVVAERDPARWARAARELLRAASPTPVRSERVRVRFENDLGALPPRDVSTWNPTWIKPGATPLAEAEAAGGAKAPMAARWAAGEGVVAAAAFAAPTAQEVEALARLAGRAPSDPRLRVGWDAGRRLRVSVDAVDGNAYLNGLALTLELADPARGDVPPETRAIPQTGPGRYALDVDAPRLPRLGTVRRAGGGVVGRAAVPGRYAPEFEAVGNDRAAMRALAERGGGAVVEPAADAPLHLSRPRREVALLPWFAASGAACVAFGLVWWKRS